MKALLTGTAAEEERWRTGKYSGHRINWNLVTNKVWEREKGELRDNSRFSLHVWVEVTTSQSGKRAVWENFSSYSLLSLSVALLNTPALFTPFCILRSSQSQLPTVSFLTENIKTVWCWISTLAHHLKKPLFLVPGHIFFSCSDYLKLGYVCNQLCFGFNVIWTFSDFIHFFHVFIFFPQRNTEPSLKKQRNAG